MQGTLSNENSGLQGELLGASWVAQMQVFKAGDGHGGAYSVVEDLEKSIGCIFVTLG